MMLRVQKINGDPMYESLYPLYFLVEGGNLQGEYTPFNLLPKEWVNFHHVISLASLIPSNPKNFSYGWINPRYHFMQTPLIYFYTSKEIKHIQKGIPVNSNKIFFASEPYSIEIIKSLISPEYMTIVVTKNKIYKELLSETSVILIISDDLNEIIQKLYSQILKTYNCCRTFDDKVIDISDFKNGCLPKKRFLSSIEITPNLLCQPNEIILNITRGKITKYSINNSKILDLEGCYKKNVELTYEIMSEKFIDIFLSIYLYSIRDSSYLIPPTLKKQIKVFLKYESKFSDIRKKNKYNLMKKGILKANKLSSQEELILLIPSIPNSCKSNVEETVTKQFDPKYNAEIKQMIRSIFEGGKGATFKSPENMSEEETQKLFGFFQELGNTRLVENYFTTFFTTVYASRKISPVIKTATVSSNLYIKFSLLRYKIKQRDLPEKISKDFCEIQLKLKKSFPPIYHELMKDLSLKKYTIFSDLPFELMILSNNEVFCDKYQVTRIPIIPLKSLLYQTNYFNRSPSKIELDSYKDILFINSISQDDQIYSEYTIFKHVCEQKEMHLNFNDVKKSKEFIDLINEEKPAILIYFGHASYDNEKDKGYLEFENDKLSLESLNEIKSMPIIVFLIGCETASTEAFGGGLPSHFLSRGAESVLATLFPIPANHAGSFVGRILSMIYQAKDVERNYSLAEIVYKARKLGWVMDRLESLFQSGVIDEVELFVLLKEISETLTELSIEKNRDLTTKEADPIFEKILEEHGILSDWELIKLKTIPYSLFFTLLGRAHDV